RRLSEPWPKTFPNGGSDDEPERTLNEPLRHGGGRDHHHGGSLGCRLFRPHGHRFAELREQQMKRTAKLILMMIRPPTAAVLILFSARGLAPEGKADGVRPLFTTVLVIIAGWFINATVLNDLGDEPIDRVNLQNARGRPLVSGE